MGVFQDVSNWLSGSYKVRTTKLADAAQVQHVRLDIGSGVAESVVVGSIPVSSGLITPLHDEQVINEALAPATTVITYKLAGATVATKTITVAGTTTTIKMS
jgi:hypothetical protein